MYSPDMAELELVIIFPRRTGIFEIFVLIQLFLVNFFMNNQAPSSGISAILVFTISNGYLNSRITAAIIY